jgi:hypothetical protein
MVSIEELPMNREIVELAIECSKRDGLWNEPISVRITDAPEFDYQSDDGRWYKVKVRAEFEFELQN